MLRRSSLIDKRRDDPLNKVELQFITSFDALTIFQNTFYELQNYSLYIIIACPVKNGLTVKLTTCKSVCVIVELVLNELPLVILWLFYYCN
jgi:hypothetical protein